jgi:murein DD-endopeptidase MepM/ murein hydrolase activator NlpD
MFRRWSAVVLMALVIGTPVTAGASGSWKWPVDGEPALSYGASYVSAAGKSCTHGGLDIAAPSGSRVVAAAAGEVVFSGLVPAGEGARAFAVTVLTSEGLRITYLPLASSAVRKGQAVDAGQDVGSLEGTGDASGGGSHLHLGVDRKSVV